MSQQSFIRRQAAGFYLSTLAIVLTVVATIMFFTVDPAFENFLSGVYVTPFVVFAVLAVLANLIVIIVGQKLDNDVENGPGKDAWMLILHIVTVLVAVLALLQMIHSGVYEMAMALGSLLGDHETAYYFVAVLVVDVLSIVMAMAASFCKVSKVSQKNDN